MTEAQDRAYLSVEEALLDDPDADVTSTDEGLVVHGRLFAARSSDGALVALLPADRADDLVARGVAEVDHRSTDPAGTWVRVADEQDWVEMATEAHAFVGEPPVGRDS